MTRRANADAEMFSRRYDGQEFSGVRFFETKAICKMVARHVRRVYGIPVRSVVIPESAWPRGYPERYVLMLPVRSVMPGEMDKVREAKRYLWSLPENPGEL